MTLDLSKLIDRPGGQIAFQTQMDLSDLQFGKCRPVTEPVVASGTVRNQAGVLQIEGSISTTLHGVCDRCASEFTRAVTIPIQAVLVTQLADARDEDLSTFLLRENAADLDEIVNTFFVLSMDSQLLCREDCKGLCCRCGKNLNFGPCDCAPEPDPRWSALRQLLKREQ